MMKTIEINRNVIPPGSAKQICPSMIKIPPQKMVRLVPKIRSAIQPPIIPDMYTNEPYIDIIEAAVVLSIPKPPLATVSYIK